MSMRTVLVVALALVFGISAAFGVSMYVRQTNAAPPIAKVAIVVAKTDIVRLLPLTAEQLQVRQVPKDMVLKGTLTKVEDAVGRVPLYPVTTQEPILDQKLAKLGAPRAVSATIPKGMRAFNIQNTKVAGANSGFLQPGDKVDVLAVYTAVTRVGSAAAVTLLSKIEVLAVDQSITPSAADAKVNVNELRSVTLLVTPVQAEKLTEAQTNGSLQVTLRNPEDDMVVAERPPEPPKQEASKEEPKQPAPPPVVVAAEPPPPASIRTLRGVDEGVVFLQPAATTPSKR